MLPVKVKDRARTETAYSVMRCSRERDSESVVYMSSQTQFRGPSTHHTDQLGG